MNSVKHVTLPSYSYIFRFEKDYDHADKQAWMTKNWTVCFYYVGLYMILVFGGQQYMQNRPAFKLRRTLATWNLFLAAFSIMGACRTISEFVHILKYYGFYHSVCIPSFIESNKVTGFWTWMFVLSKVPELGDTVFIILRKRPLIFLHWYHHVTVLIYAWYSFTEFTAPARWFMVMNYLVHSVMYTYYALKAMGYHLPSWLSIFITSTQLAQMVIGCCISIWAYQIKQQGEDCHVSYQNVNLSLLMYISYFVLFARFFYKAYLSKKFKKE